MAIISNCTAAAVSDAASSLIAGNLVAFPTETVYGLGADATNQSAVARIYSVKGRPTDHPLIIHLSSISNLDKWASDIPEYAIKLARKFWPGPMTLILPRTKLAKDFITGGQDNVGIRVPQHTVAQALLKAFESQGGYGVAAPSANRFGKVSPTCAEDVKSELADYLSTDDLILDGGQSEVGVESTIIDCTNLTPMILRPGAITYSMIFDLTGIEPGGVNKVDTKASGLLVYHYASNARVIIDQIPAAGDGFIALANTPTPDGAIRLAAPKDNKEYAQLLYQALRLADTKQLQNVIVIPPTGDDLAVAICDRLEKSAYQG